MVLIVLHNEILHHGSRLKESNALAVAERVCHRWNPAIGIDFEEPGLFLLIFVKRQFGHFVRKTIQMISLAQLIFTMTNPSSSRRIEILIPFGVCAVYKCKEGESDMLCCYDLCRLGVVEIALYLVSPRRAPGGGI